MSSSCDNKPDLALSPRVRKLLELESQFTAGGFEPMPYFFEKAQGSLLWVSEVKGMEIACKVTNGCRTSMEIDISILLVCSVQSIRDTAIPISRRL